MERMTELERAVWKLIRKMDKVQYALYVGPEFNKEFIEVTRLLVKKKGKRHA
jgi:hypothetical protein